MRSKICAELELEGVGTEFFVNETYFFKMTKQSQHLQRLRFLVKDLICKNGKI